MSKYNFCRFFFIFCFFFPFSLFANYTSKGQAYIFQNQIQLAKTTAFQNAQKNLLEKALLEKLSQDEWNNYQEVIKNRIFINPSQYIVMIEVLSEKKERNSYFYRIKGDVLVEKIISEIFTENIKHQKRKAFLFYSFFNDKPYFIDNLQVKYFFQQLELELKSISLDFNPFLNRTLNKRWEYLKKLEESYVLESSKDTEKILKDISLEKKILKEKILQNLNSQGYSTVIFLHISEPTIDLDNFVFKKKELLFEVTIYDLELDLEVKKKNIRLPFFSNTRANTLAHQNDIKKNIKKFSLFFLDYLNHYFYSYYFQQKNQKYDIILYNYSQIEEQIIQSALKNLEGYQRLVTQETRNRLNITYYSDISSTRLPYTILGALKKLEFPTKLKEEDFLQMSFTKIKNKNEIPTE